MQDDTFNESMKKLEEIETITGENLDILRHPKRVHEITFPYKGTMIKGYRVQYNDSLGPTKGGIRFHPQADKAETKALAFWMSIKNALMGLPYGGGKGALVIDANQFSREEQEGLTREFTRHLHPYIGPAKDIPAPDVYTDKQTMAWMMDEYNKIHGATITPVVTGKPPLLGGSALRERATSEGGYDVLQEALRQYGMRQVGLSITIQGFGNAGRHLARILVQQGHHVIAVSDSHAAVFNDKGLDIEALEEHKKQTGSVSGYGNAREITQQQLLSLDSDVLALAALSGAIDENNAGEVSATIILELANGPVTQAAESVLHENDITVLPDILANAGGVTVSYLEWMQNLGGASYSEKEARRTLYEYMHAAFTQVIGTQHTYDVPLRTAAYIHATQRILTAERMLGHLPA